MFKNCIEAQEEFEKCWLNPSYTAIELDDVDIRQALSHYIVQPSVHFTKTLLWDMEAKKAWNPGDYIPYVIKTGSAKAWEKQPCPITGGEIFVRCSQQKQWLNPDVYEDVYEEVYVNPKNQLITFLGVTTLPGLSSQLTPKQPLFHVQHGVGGEENHPTNTWRIVHLTKNREPQLIKLFENMNDPTTLPGFVKMYIEKDLHVVINKK